MSKINYLSTAFWHNIFKVQEFFLAAGGGNAAGDTGRIQRSSTLSGGHPSGNDMAKGRGFCGRGRAGIE